MRWPKSIANSVWAVARALAAVLIAIGAQAVPACAQTFTVLYTFSGGSDGKSPVGNLLLDSAGNFYGTTLQGGDPTCSCGTIYELTPSGTFIVFHVFTGEPSDGANPSGGLSYWQDYFYGATSGGGSYGTGTAYKISDRGPGYAMLHSFTGTDGTSPEGRLALDTKTNLYGVAAFGGDSGCSSGMAGTTGCGTIFKLDSAGKETVLYTFKGGSDGSTPYELDGLIRDPAGNLFGTTYGGGDPDCTCPSCQIEGVNLPQGCGTIFKLDPAGDKTVLYAFMGTTGDGCGTCADGIGPLGGLIKGPSGSYYGTTSLGGDPGCSASGLGCGTFFVLSSTDIETIVHKFANGNSPEMLSAAYGVSVNGGAYGYGSVFRVNGNGSVSILHDFTGGADGAFPQTGLIRDTAGNLYGATAFGGNLNCSNTLPSGCGTIFKIAAATRKASAEP